MILGIHLTLLIGSVVPVPAPLPVAEALESVEVTHNDEGRSGFQLTFEIGRSGPWDLVDYPLLRNPLVRPFSRVILLVLFNVTPRVLMDGFITNVQVAPGAEPGAGRLTVTGEDVTVMMDMEKKTREHPAQDETVIASKILLSYMQYLLLPPLVVPPLVIDPPVPVERTPAQSSTDLEYLNEMAGRHGHVFFVTPGPAPGQNLAHWGPPPRGTVPQRALSTNMGPATNVRSMSFQYNALAPTLVAGQIQDRLTNQSVPFRSLPLSTRVPLASLPALPLNLPNVRTTRLENSQGLSFVQAMARAQSVTTRSTDNVVTASGDLDALRYGEILRPRGIVGVRGAGFSYDGFYYVKRVTHKIRRGEYMQAFTLTREGTGALSPVVAP
ncbi:MAG: hypothetical protein IT208_11550 [Chthonomonadales bacterium]|nr:hypothetical protein [Chthonomonadales bacterium]